MLSNKNDNLYYLTLLKQWSIKTENNLLKSVIMEIKTYVAYCGFFQLNDSVVASIGLKAGPL